MDQIMGKTKGSTINQNFFLNGLMHVYSSYIIIDYVSYMTLFNLSAYPVSELCWFSSFVRLQDFTDADIVGISKQKMREFMAYCSKTSFVEGEMFNAIGSEEADHAVAEVVNWLHVMAGY